MACKNNYMPEYVPEDLHCYKRDVNIDQAKCQDFSRDRDGHFKKEQYS